MRLFPGAAYKERSAEPAEALRGQSGTLIFACAAVKTNKRAQRRPIAGWDASVRAAETGGLKGKRAAPGSKGERLPIYESSPAKGGSSSSAVCPQIVQ